MTPEERTARILGRIKQLDDPEHATPYALHALITREIDEAIADEREACAKYVEAIAPTEYVRRIAAAIRART